MNIKSFLFVSVCLLFCSCDNEQMKEYNTLKVNEFIRDCMQEAYLWSEQMPNLDINKESNPKQYFKKLLFDMLEFFAKSAIGQASLKCFFRYS